MNNQSNQVDALKQAMLDRARKLAAEHIAQGSQSRQKILEATHEKIQLMEQKELLLAKTQAEREYLRKVQAREIQLQAELDRNRWGMVQVVVDKLTKYLRELPDKQTEYRKILIKLLAQANKLLKQDNAVAYLNQQDYQQFSPQWQQIIEQVGNTTLLLSDHTINSSGGVKLISQDGDIMVDNSFEGLLSRKQEELHNVIFERLFATVTGTGGLSHG